MSNAAQPVIGELIAALTDPGAINHSFARHITRQLQTLQGIPLQPEPPQRVQRRPLRRFPGKKTATTIPSRHNRGVGREADLAGAFVTLADTFRPSRTVSDTTNALVNAAVSLTSADDAGIVLADDNQILHVIASTRERAVAVEEAQIGATEGPCFESFRTGRTIDVPDIAAVAHRWPEFTKTATEFGYRAAHATPLTVEGTTLGAMNVFSLTPGPLPLPDVALIAALAHVTTVGLLQGRRARQQADTNDALRRALESRDRIERAKEMLAAHRHIRSDHAFTLLQRHSQRAHTSLDATARRVLTGHPL